MAPKEKACEYLSDIQARVWLVDVNNWCQLRTDVNITSHKRNIPLLKKVCSFARMHLCCQAGRSSEAGSPPLTKNQTPFSLPLGDVSSVLVLKLKAKICRGNRPFSHSASEFIGTLRPANWVGYTVGLQVHIQQYSRTYIDSEVLISTESVLNP